MTKAQMCTILTSANRHLLQVQEDEDRYYQVIKETGKTPEELARIATQLLMEIEQSHQSHQYHGDCYMVGLFPNRYTL